MTVNFSKRRSRSAISSRLTGSVAAGSARLGIRILGGLTFGGGISVTVPLRAGTAGSSAAAAHDDHVGQVLLRVDVVLADLLRLRLDQGGVRGDLLCAGRETLDLVDVPVGRLVDELPLIARAPLHRD